MRLQAIRRVGVAEASGPWLSPEFSPAWPDGAFKSTRWTMPCGSSDGSWARAPDLEAAPSKRETPSKGRVRNNRHVIRHVWIHELNKELVSKPLYCIMIYNEYIYIYFLLLLYKAS